MGCGTSTYLACCSCTRPATRPGATRTHTPQVSPSPASYTVRVPVLRIRIRMFLGLLDSDADPLVRGMDPDPDTSIIVQNSKKNLDFYCFVTSFCFFIFEKLCKCSMYLQKVISRKTFWKISFLLASWSSLTKVGGSGSASGSISQRHGSPDPDPHQNVMDPQHWRVRYIKKSTALLRHAKDSLAFYIK